MPSDMAFTIGYSIVMAITGAANIWLVARAYRRCIQHLDDCKSNEVLRQDLANITFGALMAVAWGVLVGVSIGGIAREFRWVEAALLFFVLGVIGILAVRPFKQLLHRLPDDPQPS